jgi:hypothetical protein
MYICENICMNIKWITLWRNKRNMYIKLACIKNEQTYIVASGWEAEIWQKCYRQKDL